MLATTTIETLATWATVGTAVGTIGLAIATFVLARKAAKEIDISNRQAKAAEEAVRAQTQPLLSPVPWQPVERVDQTRPPPQNRTEIRGYLADDIVWFSAPFRNIGAGAAFIEDCISLFEDQRVQLYCSMPAVAAGDIAYVTGGLYGITTATPGFEAAQRTIGSTEPFRVVITYADAAGTPRGAVRLDIGMLRQPTGVAVRWQVEKAAWGDTAEQVQQAPRFESLSAF